MELISLLIISINNLYLKTIKHNVKYVKLQHLKKNMTMTLLLNDHHQKQIQFLVFYSKI